MASNLFIGLDNRATGNRQDPTLAISTGARRQGLAELYRPSVFQTAMQLANEESRNILQHGQDWLGFDKYEDITGSVVDDQFIKTFKDVDPAKIKEGLPTALPKALTLEDIMAGTTMEERKKTLVDMGELRDERVFLEKAPLGALGYGDDFIHRINESDIPDYDAMSAYSKIRSRLIETDEFQTAFERFVQENFEGETLEGVTEERLAEMQNYFFNIYQGKDGDEEYQKYLSGELKEEFSKEEAAIDILKRRDFESLKAHEAELERAMGLSMEGTGMQMVKLMAGSIVNPIDLTIIAGDVLVGTKGAASVGSKFSMIARVMEKAKLMNNKIVPGTNYARRTEDVYDVAWTMARRELVYLGLTEGVIGAVELGYHMDNGDTFAEAFNNSADRLIGAPAAGAVIRGAGSIVFDKINLRGGVKGIITVDEIAVMTRELEDAFGSRANPAARIEIARLLNESTELGKLNNDIPVLRFRDSNTEVDEAMRSFAHKTIAEQKADIIKAGANEIEDFVKLPDITGEFNRVYRPLVYGRDDADVVSENDIVGYRAQEREFSTDEDKIGEKLTQDAKGPGIYVSTSFDENISYINSKSNMYEMTFGRPDGKKMNIIDVDKDLTDDDIEHFLKVLSDNSLITEKDIEFARADIKKTKDEYGKIGFARLYHSIKIASMWGDGVLGQGEVKRLNLDEIFRDALYKAGYDGGISPESKSRSFFNKELIKSVRRNDGAEVKEARRGKRKIVEQGPTLENITQNLVRNLVVNSDGDLSIKLGGLTKVEKGILEKLGFKHNKRVSEVNRDWFFREKGEMYLGYSEFRKLDIFKKRIEGDETVISVNQSLSKDNMLTIRRSIAEWIEDSNELVKDEYKVTDIEAYMKKMFDDNILDVGDQVYLKNSMPTTFLMHFVNPEMSIWRRKFKQYGMEDNLTNIAMAIGTSGDDITRFVTRRVDENGEVIDPVGIEGGGEITNKAGLNIFQDDIEFFDPSIKAEERAEIEKNLPKINEILNVLAMRADAPYHNLIKFFHTGDDTNRNLFNTLKVLESQGSPINIRSILNKFIEADITLEDIKQIHDTFKIEVVDVDGKQVEKVRNSKTKELFSADVNTLDDLYKAMLDEKIRIKNFIKSKAVAYEVNNKKIKEVYDELNNSYDGQRVVARIPGEGGKSVLVVEDVRPTKAVEEEVNEAVETPVEEVTEATEAAATTPTPAPVVEEAPINIRIPGLVGFGGESKKVSKIVDEVEIEKEIPAGARDITEEEANVVSSQVLKRHLQSLSDGFKAEDERFLEFLPNDQAREVFTVNGRISEVTNMVNARRFDDRDKNMGFWTGIQNRDDAHVLSGDIDRHLYKYNVTQEKYSADIAEIDKKLQALEAKRNVPKKNETEEAARNRVFKIDTDRENLIDKRKEIEHKKNIYLKPDVDDEKRAEVAAYITKKFNQRVNEYMDKPMFTGSVFDHDFIEINGVKYKTDGFRYKPDSEKADSLMPTAGDVRGKGLKVESVTAAKLPKPDNMDSDVVYVVKRRGDTPQFEFHYNGKKMVVNTNVGFNSLGKFYEHPKLGDPNVSSDFIKFKDAEDAIFSIIHKEANKVKDRNTIELGDNGMVKRFREQDVARGENNSAEFRYNGGKYIIGKDEDGTYSLSFENAEGRSVIIGTKMKDEQTGFRIISNNTNDEVGNRKVGSCMDATTAAAPAASGV